MAGADLVDWSGMVVSISSRVSELLARAGWDDVVDSLKGAIEDPSHVNTLGIALGLVLAVWVNFRIARWLMKRAGDGGGAERSGPG